MARVISQEAKAQKQARSKALYRDRLARGACTRCGKHPSKADALCCQHCADKTKAGQRRRRKRLLGRGTCFMCGVNPVAQRSKSRCAGCLDDAQIDVRQRESERVAAGRCARCNRESTDPTCRRCLDKHNATSKRKYDAEREHVTSKRKHDAERANRPIPFDIILARQLERVRGF